MSYSLNLRINIFVFSAPKSFFHPLDVPLYAIGDEENALCTKTKHQCLFLAKQERASKLLVAGMDSMDSAK